VLFRTFGLWRLWLRNRLFGRGLRILVLLPCHRAEIGMQAFEDVNIALWLKCEVAYSCESNSSVSVEYILTSSDLVPVYPVWDCVYFLP